MLLLPLNMINTINACPTCLGRLEGDTPPLFTKEYDAYFWPEESNEDTEPEEGDQHHQANAKGAKQ